MKDEDSLRRGVVEHILWCQGERDRLAAELAQYEAGARSIGTRKTGEANTTGSLTHMMYLRRTIEQLERVISAYSPPPG